MSVYKPEVLRVFIPVGGGATRLKPLTAETSKACVRILNRPLVEISMMGLAKQGVRNFIFGVKGFFNYKSLFDYFKEGSGFSARYNVSSGVHIKYSPNIEDVGSADSLRLVMEYYDIKEPIFVIQGDNICDIELQKLISFHEEKKAFATIVLTNVDDVESYGITMLNEDMRILKFVEKPKKDEAPSNLASTGLYLFNSEIREVFQEQEVQEMIYKKKRLDFGYDLIPYIVKTGRPVYGYVLKGKWFDVGTPSKYLETVKTLLYGQLKFFRDFGGKLSEEENIWIQGTSAESLRKREEIIMKLRMGMIRFEGMVLMGRHCSVGDGVEVVDSCVDNFTVVGDNTKIINSAVLDRVRIGKNVEILESIVGRHSNIEISTKIVSSVIGDNVSINENCIIIGTKIYPHLRIPLNRKYINQTLQNQEEV